MEITSDPYKKENPLLHQSFHFALAVMDYCEELTQLKKFEMLHQLFKSGTSIHAQIREAQYPESDADFVHKLKIGAKEASETEGWLLLCKYSPTYPGTDHLLNMLLPIQKMLTSSISTAKKKKGFRASLLSLLHSILAY